MTMFTTCIQLQAKNTDSDLGTRQSFSFATKTTRQRCLNAADTSNIDTTIVWPEIMVALTRQCCRVPSSVNKNFQPALSACLNLSKRLGHFGGQKTYTCMHATKSLRSKKWYEYLHIYFCIFVFFLFTVVFVLSLPHSKNVASQTFLANIFLTPTGNKFCRQRQESSWSSECQSEVQISSTSSHERYCIKMVIIC